MNTIRVSSEVKSRLYDAQVRGEPIMIIDARPYGWDDTWTLDIVSDRIPPHSETMQEVFFTSDGSFNFKPYRPDFWEC